MESISVGHSIQDRLRFFDLLDNFDVGLTLLLVYLLAFIGVLTLSVILGGLSERIRSGRRKRLEFSKRIALAVRNFHVTELSAIAIFILFVNLFLWISELFLTNNIKVSYFSYFEGGNPLTNHRIHPPLNLHHL